MDICTRFGMDYDPFLKNAPQTAFEGHDYKEAFTRLSFLQETKGFGVVTGEPGTGKTTVLRYWSRSLNSSIFKVVYTALSTLTVMEFYRNICFSIGIEPFFKKCDNILAIQNEISRLYVERHITPVFIFDEISYAKPNILNDLKLLFNFEMDSQDRAIVLLAGLPNFISELNLKAHLPLKQRIIMNYNMEGLNKSETKSYISSRLQNAHCTKPVFTDNALEAIANISNGIPRVVSKMAHSALVTANSKGLDYIDADLIQLVFEDSELN